MNNEQATAALIRLGWHPRIPFKTMVESFQSIVGITVDGIVGPVTSDRLTRILADGGHIPGSVYHRFTDFACHCGGDGTPESGCKGVYVLPALVSALDRYARYCGGKPAYASTYRCPGWNLKVGGAADSQHQYGAAADVPLKYPLNTVESLRVFSGLGWQSFAGQRLVRHVDVRHASGHNLTGGSTNLPTVWHY